MKSPARTLAVGAALGISLIPVGALRAVAATTDGENGSGPAPLGGATTETVARETGVSSDHRLYGDTLGPKGSTGATYLRMEAANANEMVRGFTGGARGCTAATP